MQFECFRNKHSIFRSKMWYFRWSILKYNRSCQAINFGALLQVPPNYQLQYWNHCQWNSLQILILCSTNRMNSNESSNFQTVMNTKWNYLKRMHISSNDVCMQFSFIGNKNEFECSHIHDAPLPMHFLFQMQ